MPDSDWHEQAKCRKPWVNLDWFFPKDTGEPNSAGERRQEYGDDGLRARMICAACPVRQKCWVENRDAEVGIFAGTDERNRWSMFQTARRREQLAAKRDGRPSREITWRDLPGPGTWINWARANAPISLVRVTGAGRGVVSTRLQIALYAFMHGSTVTEAAKLSEVEEQLFRKHITPMERLAA